MAPPPLPADYHNTSADSATPSGMGWAAPPPAAAATAPAQTTADDDDDWGNFGMPAPKPTVSNAGANSHWAVQAPGGGNNGQDYNQASQNGSNGGGGGGAGGVSSSANTNQVNGGGIFNL